MPEALNIRSRTLESVALNSQPPEEEDLVEDAFLQRYGGRLLGGAEAERSQGKYLGLLESRDGALSLKCSAFILE